MAYQTGTASGANDLLDKLRLFAVANGWSVNRWATAGSGRELCLAKGSAFFSLRSYQNETVPLNGRSDANKTGIAVTGSDGYSAGSGWDRQPGYPQQASGGAKDQYSAYLPFVTSQGPFPAYHLFATGSKTIYLEVEVTTGVFQRLGFGSLDLFNPASAGGGRFFYASGGDSSVTDSSAASAWLGAHIDNGPYSLEEVPFRAADYGGVSYKPGSCVRAAFGSFDNWCGSQYRVAGSLLTQVCQGGGVHDKLLRDLSPNPLNGIGILTPNIVSVLRGEEFLSPLGEVPGMRYMDMTNYLPGDEFSLGSDLWKVFPWYQKGGRSYQRGIALLKVV